MDITTGKNIKIEFADSTVKEGIANVATGKAADIIRNAKKKADTNKDGKISTKEWVTYFLNNPSLLFVVVLGMFANPLVDFINVGITTGVWDWTIVTAAVGSFIVPLIFGWFFKQNDSHAKDLVQDERHKRIDVEKDMDVLKKEYEAKLRAKDDTIHQLNLVLELKKQEIVFMEKGYVNGKHRTVLDEDFNK